MIGPQTQINGTSERLMRFRSRFGKFLGILKFPRSVPTTSPLGSDGQESLHTTGADGSAVHLPWAHFQLVYSAPWFLSFSTIWEICAWFKVNPNGLKTVDKGAVCAGAIHLPSKSLARPGTGTSQLSLLANIRCTRIDQPRGLFRFRVATTLTQTPWAANGRSDRTGTRPRGYA